MSTLDKGEKLHNRLPLVVIIIYLILLTWRIDRLEDRQRAFEKTELELDGKILKTIGAMLKSETDQ